MNSIPIANGTHRPLPLSERSEIRSEPPQTDAERPTVASRIEPVCDWIVERVRDYPGTTLLVTLAIGGMAGWLIKRRI